MYCLKVSLRCIHWPPFAIVAIVGDQRKTARGGCCTWRGIEGARVERDIIKKAPSFHSLTILFVARCAFRVSREFRIFWRLQNISGPVTPRKTRNPSRILHEFVWKIETLRVAVQKKGRKEGRKEEGRSDIERWKVLEGRSRRQVISETFFSVTKDAQWFAGIDRSGIHSIPK